MFLSNRLLHSDEGYSDGDLGASAARGLQAKCAAEFSGALLHYGNAEVSAARSGTIGGIEAAAVVADGKIQSISLVLEVDGDGGWLRVANRVRDSLLADADKMMDTAGGERDLFSFDIERCPDYFLHVICGKGAGQGVRKNVCDLLGVAQIPDNPASFGLTVCNHASSQFAGPGRGGRVGVTVAEELGGGLELP